MIDRFNKKVAMATDGTEDDFFSDAPTVGNPSGTYVAFLARQESADKLTAFVGDDLVDTEPYNDARANNGGGRSGTFVRFEAGGRSIEEIRRFVATLD